MRIPSSGLFLALLLVCSPAVSQTARLFEADRPFAETDKQVLCELLTAYPVLDRMGFASFSIETSEDSRLDDLAQKIIWKSVPKKIKCGSVSFQLQSAGYSNFLQNMGISADGQFAAFAGGYLYGPMHGGGGECIFRRAEGGWKLEGCLGTWDV